MGQKIDGKRGEMRKTRQGVRDLDHLITTQKRMGMTMEEPPDAVFREPVYGDLSNTYGNSDFIIDVKPRKK